MTLVRLPSRNHAISEPMNALPRPIHIAAEPNRQPNWPENPTKTTA